MRALPLLPILLVLASLLGCAFSANKVTVLPTTVAYPHYWEGCVGSGHATLGLRSDFREQLKLAREKLGFERLRFHGLLNDDMSVYSEDAQGKAVYSFFNVDQHFDYLLSIGMRPLVELSFMPERLASRPNETIFHYKGGTSPPSSYSKWSQLMTELVKHLVERYGLDEVAEWHFEVWNEPNCDFWTGTKAEYFKLLQVTYQAIKSVSRRLKVGGPATCQLAWIPETIRFARASGIELDFIATHIYPTDFEDAKNISRNIMQERLAIAHAQSSGIPLFITEFNSGLYCCLHDTPFASAFLISQIPKLDKYAPILSYWTFSDIFEEWPFKSSPFQSGFGLQTIHGIPKPAFRAYELLHRTGARRYSIESLNLAKTLDVFATTNGTHSMILISNWHTPGNAISQENIVVDLTAITNDATGILERIDEDHANPQRTWINQGSPMYPSKKQLREIMDASELVAERIYTSQNGVFQLFIPPQGVACITVANK